MFARLRDLGLEVACVVFGHRWRPCPMPAYLLHMLEAEAGRRLRVACHDVCERCGDARFEVELPNGEGCGPIQDEEGDPRGGLRLRAGDVDCEHVSAMTADLAACTPAERVRIINVWCVACGGCVWHPDRMPSTWDRCTCVAEVLEERAGG